MCSSMKDLKFSVALLGSLWLSACGLNDEFNAEAPRLRSTAFLEVVHDGIDLMIVDAAAASTVLEPDTVVAVSARVGNQGATASTASQLRYLLSSDAILDASDKYLNYDSVAALLPGQSGAESANLRIPASWPLGGAFILVVADFKAEVSEADETNNVWPIGIEVTEHKVPTSEDLPELAVQNSRLSSTVALQGTVVEAMAEVVNQGLGNAEASQLRYYLATEPQLTDGAIYLNYDRVDALTPGTASSEGANLRIPSEIVSGDYFILFVADAKRQVAEADETNNVLARSISIGEDAVLGTADLAITSLSMEASTLYPGESLRADITVQNAGTGLSKSTSLRYYLSADSLLSADDVEVGSDTLEPLGPGASRSESALLSIHSSTRIGTYQVLAVVDASEDENTDATLENNQAQVTLILSKDRPDAALPDLTIEDVTLSAPVGLAGDPISITLNIANRGTLDAQSSRLKYYLSPKQTFDADADYLNYDAVGALAPNALSAENANLRIPSSLTDGRYYILLIADDTDTVEETLESNNIHVLSIDVGPEAVAVYHAATEEGASQDLPDLMLELERAPERDFAPGEQVPVSVNVRNDGRAAAGSSRIKYFISRDSIYDAFDKYGGYDRVDALEIEGGGIESGNPRVPSDAQGGLWYVLVVADANNEVEESEEENNVLAIPFMVDVDAPDAILPDLAVTDFEIDAERYQPNTQAQVNLQIANQGVESAASSRLKFYWSNDEHYDAQDRFLDYRRVPALEVSETASFSVTLRIPFEASSGARYLLVVLDVEGRVDERFESNNVYPQLVTIDALGKAEESPAFDCPDFLTMDPSLDRNNAIGSMNVLHMGWDNGKNYDGLACVLSHFAISALNEVESEEAMQTLEAALEARTAEAWSYHISPQEVGNDDGREYYAFVWRDERVEFLGGVGFFDDPNDVIKRDPYGANFKMDAFDFTLVAFHQRNGGSIAIRRAEAEHFADIVSFFQEANGTEEDVLIGGDFNLPGNDPAFTAVGWNGVTYSVDHEQPTSISDAGLRNSFDNIFYQEHLLTELQGAGVLDFTRGNHAELRWSISDHIPVWITVDASQDFDE